MGGAEEAKLRTYKELDTEYNIIIISPQRPHSGEFGDLMTKMVERGRGGGSNWFCQLLIQRYLNSRFWGMGGVLSIQEKKKRHFCTPDWGLPDNKLLLKLGLNSPGFFIGSNRQTDIDIVCVRLPEIKLFFSFMILGGGQIQRDLRKIGKIYRVCYAPPVRPSIHPSDTSCIRTSWRLLQQNTHNNQKIWLLVFDGRAGHRPPAGRPASPPSYKINVCIIMCCL